MKLYSAKLERALSRRVRREIKRSPELKRQAKKRRRHYSLPPTTLFWVFGAMFVWNGMRILGKEGGLELQLVFAALLSLYMVCWIATRLIGTLYSSPDLAALFYFPIEDGDIFDRQWRVSLRKSGWVTIAFFVLYAFVILPLNSSIWGWLCLVGISLVQWWVCVLCAIWMIARFPRFPFGAVVVSGYVSLFLALIGGAFLKSAAISLIQKLSAIPFWVVPPGWVTLMIEGVDVKNYSSVIGVLLLVAAFSYSLPFALSRLRGYYHLLEPEQNPEDDLAEDEFRAPSNSRDASPAYRVGPTEIEDDIRGGGLRRSPERDELHPSERWLMRCLNARERMLVQFSLAETGWFAQWRRAAIFVAILVVITAFAGFVPWRPSIIFYFFASYLLGARFVSVSNPLARVFTPLFFGGTNVPWYSGFPISYHELSRIIIKLNGARLLAFSPLILVYGITTAVLYKYGWMRGAEITIKAILLLLLVQPAIVVFFFSSGTNDTSRSGCLFAFIVLAIVFVAIGFAALVMGALFLENNWHGALCALGAGVISFAFHQSYGWAFNQGRFDLMQASTNQNG